MTLEILSENKAHGGRQLVVKHASTATGTDMTFSIFLPPQAEGGGKLPVVWYLSGLTCTHANVTEKGRISRRLRRAWPDLRRAGHQPARRRRAGRSEGYDFGLGAGFYVDATQEPWSRRTTACGPM